ncbi:MAG TPA: HAMP domain-containing histidine kinase [Desulfuromonadales bacterium]|nr:HAMP domain-containing histidine kinase [Desulfuromonadales bacterium]
MPKTSLLFIGISFCFTLLVAWFAWSAFKAAAPLAVENLRGTGLSISAAIEQLAVSDPSLRSLTRYTTTDIAYFTLVDRQGTVHFHTNQSLIGKPYPDHAQTVFPGKMSERRERLGTGEEVYLLRTRVHTGSDEYLLVLALHTYRADKVIRSAKAGITVVSVLTTSLWCLILLVSVMQLREKRHRVEMLRRKELVRLGEMSAVMAHEIRNPLSGIKGFAQLVEITDSIDKAHQYAGKIVVQSLRMETLVNDLLVFARDDPGERETIDLTSIVQECAVLLHTEAAGQNVTIAVNAPPLVMVSMVVDRMIQMLLNLMKNGIQAMPDGGSLVVSLHQKNSSVRISIKDSGTGISPEQFEHIFEPFWTSKTQGTGLGLALCRKVVEEHGGNLRVESSFGLGAEFIAVIPLNQREVFS